MPYDDVVFFKNSAINVRILFRMAILCTHLIIHYASKIYFIINYSIAKISLRMLFRFERLLELLIWGYRVDAASILSEKTS